MAVMRIKKSEAMEIALDLPPEKRAQIFTLHRQGYSYYDISEALDLPYPYVVQFALKVAVKEAYGDSRKVKRRLEESRLENMYQKAYESFVASGSSDWYDKLLKTSERKSKLLGLDAPQEQIITGKAGGAIQIETTNLRGLSDKELAQMKALALKAIAVKNQNEKS